MSTDTRPTPAPTRPMPGDPVPEGLVEIDGREWYAIPDVDHMAPFLVSIVSDGDRWAFASSAGPLTAGRGSAANALFPYETDDRLHDAVGSIGPVTAVRVDGTTWWPGAERHPAGRSLAKTVLGDRLLVEERHPASGLRFRTTWASCERFGFVRSATIANDGAHVRRIDLLDGLVGVLPYGLEPVVYQRMSNLTHAYKRSELVDGALAVYSLESPVSDRAEPSEVLRATTVWSCGLDGADVLLDPAAVDAFDDEAAPAGPLAPRSIVTGRPGAYLLRRELLLEPGSSVTWHVVADVAREQRDVVELVSTLRSDVDLDRLLRSEIDEVSDRLEAMMAGADAMQCTGDRVAVAHHLANVTYNVMRGGLPVDGYSLDAADVARFVAGRNRRVAARHAGWFDQLPETVARRDLLERAAATGDVHLQRLVREYLPFSFSRRHGDPSRPWNTFSIRVRDEAGNPVIHYEGNWRDVFQNWEALCLSFPEYLPGIVSLFVDASTAEGYNPYRITRDGIDWEVPEPDDPWSNIGYWGDHQVVYLLRLLDATERFLPGTLVDLLAERAFTFADVPYRIAPYDELLDDPKGTIAFDAAADAAAAQRAAEIGADGKLLPGADGDPVLTTLMEKLAIVALSKLANFVPGGGIWMNTQRPEWNDANNALVGYGLSMVTLYHLRDFCARLRDLAADGPGEHTISSEVAAWLDATGQALRELAVVPATDETGRHRKQMMDRLGAAASEYRWSIYRSGFSGSSAIVSSSHVVELCDLAIEHLDHTIRGGRFDDGLYAGYRLLALTPDGTSAAVLELEEMLEGQVAVLGCGVLTPAERLAVVEALFASRLYREDQDTFLLAPVKELPSFLDKGVLADDDVAANPLLSALLEAGDRSIVLEHVDGVRRFHADLVDAPALGAALDRLAAEERWSSLVAAQRDATIDLYERVFRHKAFLGRSGSMYAFEGIGSVYWHMVTKLLLAVQETAVAAIDDGAPADVVAGLVDGYHRVRSGLGVEKTAREFGAVPTDPYSHTPAHAGAQQPGMTGAVKEELLARPLELGIRFSSGSIEFDPTFVRPSELLEAPTTWSPLDVHGDRVLMELPAGAVGATCCQVPIVVQVADGEAAVEIEFRDGRCEHLAGRTLTADHAAAIFARTGDIVRVDARVPPPVPG